LTREAFQLYRQELAPGGILAVHISNKFLDLAPVVQSVAQPLQFSWKIIVNESDKKREVLSATWMLLSTEPQVLTDAHFPELTFFERSPRNVRAWTDDYSNLLRILK